MLKLERGLVRIIDACLRTVCDIIAAASEDWNGLAFRFCGEEMLWGEDDMALEKSCTYGTQAFVPSLCVRFLPRISHWAQQDDPDTVNTMLQAFLKGQPVPHAAGTDELSGDIG